MGGGEEWSLVLKPFALAATRGNLGDQAHFLEKSFSSLLAQAVAHAPGSSLGNAFLFLRALIRPL